LADQRKIRRILATAVLLGLAFWLGRYTKSDPPVPPEPDIPVAVDADGKMIGPIAQVYATMGQAQVIVRVEDRFVPVMLRPDSFSHATGGQVYFTGENCVGSPLVGADNQGPGLTLDPPAAVAGAKQTLYLGDLQSKRLRVIRSLLRGDECLVFEVEAYAYEAHPTLHLAEEYSPPYRFDGKP